MNLWGNWKFFVAVYVVAFGLWGFFVKLIAQKFDWITMAVLLLLSNVLFVVVLSARFVQWTWHPSLPLLVGTGVIGGVGSLAFYRAISLAPASVVIPLSAQYIVVTALLSILFLKEPFSLRLLLGIGSGLVAIVLLAGTPR